MWLCTLTSATSVWQPTDGFATASFGFSSVVIVPWVVLWTRRPRSLRNFRTSFSNAASLCRLATWFLWPGSSGPLWGDDPGLWVETSRSSVSPSSPARLLLSSLDFSEDSWSIPSTISELALWSGRHVFLFTPENKGPGFLLLLQRIKEENRESKLGSKLEGRLRTKKAELLKRATFYLNFLSVSAF